MYSKQPGPHSRNFRLSPHSQTESSPRVCPLKPKIQNPAAAGPSRCTSGSEKCGDMAGVSAGFCLPCLAESQHPHTPLQQSPSHSSYLSLWTPQTANWVPWMRETFLFDSSPPWVEGSSRFLFFFPCFLPGYVVSFLQCWLLRDLLQDFRWYAVRVVPHVDVFLMCL